MIAVTNTIATSRIPRQTFMPGTAVVGRKTRRLLSVRRWTHGDRRCFRLVDTQESHYDTLRAAGEARSLPRPCPEPGWSERSRRRVADVCSAVRGPVAIVTHNPQSVGWHLDVEGQVIGRRRGYVGLLDRSPVDRYLACLTATDAVSATAMTRLRYSTGGWSEPTNDPDRRTARCLHAEQLGSPDERRLPHLQGGRHGVRRDFGDGDEPAVDGEGQQHADQDRHCNDGCERQPPAIRRCRGVP